MPTLVVPFRGTEGKSRLDPLPADARAHLAVAMFRDVLAACAAVGPTFAVAPPETDVAGATAVVDPGGGQGPAVRAAIDAAVLATGTDGPYLVVNADLPCVTPRDLVTLAGAIPEQGLALARAADGTTNALGLASADLFVPLYGPGSSARFAGLGPSREVDAPNLIDDVDTVADLERLGARLGPCTRSVLASLRLGAAA